MAITHGEQSDYLRTSQLKNLLHGSLWRFIGVGVLLLLLFVISQLERRLTDYAFFVALVLIILLLEPFSKFIIRSYRKPEKTADKFYRGREGEKIIFEELKKLSDDYHVFYDVQIKNSHGNIDFVVAGPTGVFIIEVKSHKNGEVGFNGHELTWNGNPFEKDFLKQAKGEALQVSNYLKSKLSGNIFVQPVVAFSNFVKIHFGMNKVNGVYAIQKNYLPQLIAGGRQILTDDDVARISVAGKF